MIALDHEKAFGDLGTCVKLPDLDRRQILAFLSSAPIFALAGCGGSDAAPATDSITVLPTPAPTTVVVPVPAPQVPASTTAPTNALSSLFSAQSPWNSTPINPVLGRDTLPNAKQTPWIEESAYSSKIFRAVANDGAMTITADDIANQLEAGAVTIPRFPAATLPATGQDGHCEILDTIDGTLHSFYQLRQTAGNWRAGKYARTSWKESGWGTVTHPDNVRAAGCSTAGGLLLASELGLEIVPHALAIGMDKNAFIPGPIWPATLEDYTAATTYKGVVGADFPMGALLMLPSDFDAEALGLPESRAIARTLKKYGGYIVDATVGSMNFYAEIGSGWNKSMVAGKYTAEFNPDMQAIKAAMRQVVSQSGYLDRDGRLFTPTPLRAMNLLSMRGPWQGYNGSKAFGRYDAAANLYQAEATADARTIRQLLYTHDENDTDRFKWKKQSWNLNPEPGVQYNIRAIGEGNVTATIFVKKSDYKADYGTTGKLSPGQSTSFTWPTDPGTATEVYMDKPAGAAASIRLELIKA
ncbi:hypothetical protein [Sphingomonas faeni]|uniref:hypothetical protein n=1 Tax=Sphingomonas faeni TaxID=185950 RepID=UPI0020BE9B0A|nr:hypothetical protein [Sphingomonas faeni]MCK8457480.1 hypothetical protein [Sphingomonas faeni]